MLCFICNVDKSDCDPLSGTIYCTNCGIILEENTLVSELTFEESSEGRANVQGTFVGASGKITGRPNFGGKGRRREGPEQSLDNARRYINGLAHALRLQENHCEIAVRYYKLAVVNGFTKSRDPKHVAAVCLYAACRDTKSPTMLIDLSDALQINVFTLGSTFLKFLHKVNVILPPVDPCLYISRFAVALDFGQYTQRVAQDAVRIAERMDRDWLVTGRMPSGICGACLLIAARMNGFRRTVREVIYIVKAGESTIEKRLKEFEQLESAQLSVRDFRTTCLEKSANPPSYAKDLKKQQQQAQQTRTSVKRPNKGEGEAAPQRKKKRNSKKSQTTIGSDVTVDGSRIHIDLNVPTRSSSKRKTDTEDNDDSRGDQDEEVLGAIENRVDAILNREIRKATKKKGGKQSQADKENIPLEVTQKNKNNSSGGALVNGAEYDSDDDFVDAEEELEDPEEKEEEEEEFQDAQEEEYSDIAGYKLLPEDVQKQLGILAREKVELEKKVLVNPELDTEALAISNEMESWMNDSSVVKAAEALEQERNNLRIANSGNATSSPNDLSDVDDAEIEAMILTPEEVKTKTLIWYANNKTYLEKKAIERMVEKDDNRVTKKRRVQSATTPAEATKKLMDSRKISKKIRREVLDDMFESPEAIALIKEADKLQNAQADNLEGSPLTYEIVQEPGDTPPSYEIVEESGNAPPTETENSHNNDQDNEDADEDEETDLEDLADDERLMREGRARYYCNDNDDDDFSYYDDDDGFGD